MGENEIWDGTFRQDGRTCDQTRAIKIQRGFTNAAGSVLISSGNTVAL